MTADRDDARRLGQLYSEMSGGELERIAADS